MTETTAPAFRVTLTTPQGDTYWLRSTVWTGEVTRAATYPTEDDARNALNRARAYSKPALWRRAQIIAA